MRDRFGAGGCCAVCAGERDGHAAADHAYVPYRPMVLNGGGRAKRATGDCKYCDGKLVNPCLACGRSRKAKP